MELGDGVRVRVRVRVGVTSGRPSLPWSLAISSSVAGTPCAWRVRVRVRVRLRLRLRVRLRVRVRVRVRRAPGSALHCRLGYVRLGY